MDFLTKQYMNNPATVFPASVTMPNSCDFATVDPQSTLGQEVIRVVVDIMSSNARSFNEIENSIWQRDAVRDYKITKLTGGITNLLFLVECMKKSIADSFDACSVIVRLFGSGTSEIIDRKVENVVFANLSAVGFGPVFHGLFENGAIFPTLSVRPAFIVSLNINLRAHRELHRWIEVFVLSRTVAASYISHDCQHGREAAHRPTGGRVLRPEARQQVALEQREALRAAQPRFCIRRLIPKSITL